MDFKNELYCLNDSSFYSFDGLKSWFNDMFPELSVIKHWNIIFFCSVLISFSFHSIRHIDPIEVDISFLGASLDW